jgi:hypothetical protein
MSENEARAGTPSIPGDTPPASAPAPAPEPQEREPGRDDHDQFASDITQDDLPHWTQPPDAEPETGEHSESDMEEVKNDFDPRSGHDTGPARPD